MKLSILALFVSIFFVSCVENKDSISFGEELPTLTKTSNITKPANEVMLKNTSTVQPEETATTAPTITLTPTLSEIEIAINEMMEIVQIVEDYYEDHDEYPASMDDMIPDYLEARPVTHQGYEIMYRLSFHGIYIVSFNPAENQYCSYIKHNDMWECGFFDPSHYNDD